MPPPSSTRLFVPSAVVLVAALALSLGAHLQAYGVLGDLRALLASQAHDAATSSEIEIVLSDPPETASTPEDLLVEPEHEPTEPELPPPEHRERRRTQAERPRPRPRPEAVRPPAPPPTTTAETPPVPATEVPAPPPPPPEQRDRAAIRQHSQDPDVPPPEDAQYTADENNRVEEETVAQITSASANDPDPTAGPPEEASEADTPGESDETVVAEMQDTDGSDERIATPDEAERDDPDEATSDPSHLERPTAAIQGTDATTSAQPEEVESGAPSLGDEGGTRAFGGIPTTEVMISDGFGSFSVRVPTSEARGDGGGDVGGHRREGTGRGTSGHGLYAGHVGEEGGAPHEHGEGERDGPQLGLTYAQLEAVYGEEQLEHERFARIERRRSHARGSASAEMWDRFRAASENYIAGIRPGNQTALNAAASPFNHFIYDMHVRIHRQYAERYVPTIPVDPDDPLADMTLHTTLEIALNPDGSVFQVGIVETSGQTMFDLGVFTAFERAQPFPHPPSIILSGDGHAWLRWRFDRGPGQCGTWNAHPFILDNGAEAPATTTDAVSDADLPPEPSAESPIEMVPSAPVTTPP